MTKKDYNLIAQAIADCWVDAVAQKIIAESIADALSNESDRFDKNRFLLVCGVMESEVRI